MEFPPIFILTAEHIFMFLLFFTVSAISKVNSRGIKRMI